MMDFLNNIEDPMTVFEKKVKNHSNWIGLNNKDSMLFCDEEKGRIREAFVILPFEKILYFRDTSLINKRNEGVVLTNMGIHILVNNMIPEDLMYYSWRELISVTSTNDYFLLNVNGQSAPIAIDKDSFIKGYRDLEPKDQKTASKYITNILSSLINSAPFISQTDYTKTHQESLYHCEKNILSLADNLVNKICNENLDTMACPKEFTEFITRLKNFELFQQDINQRLFTQWENIEKAEEEMSKACRQAFQQNIVRRGHIIPKNRNDVLTDILLWTINGIANQIAESKKDKIKKRNECHQRLFSMIKEKWISNNAQDIASQLMFLNKTIRDFDKLYNNFLVKMCDTTLEIMRTTTLSCFKIHCEYIYQQQNLRYILGYQMRLKGIKINEPIKSFTKQDIILSEMNKFPKLIFGNNENAYDLWESQIVNNKTSTSLPACATLIFSLNF